MGGLQDGALPQGAHGHGGHHQGHVQDPSHMNYPNPVSFLLYLSYLTPHADLVGC